MAGSEQDISLEEEVVRLRDALEAERRVSEQWRRVAEERRVAMERLRQRRVVRWVLAIAKVVLPPVRRVSAQLHRIERRVRALVGGIAGARHRVTSRSREVRLRRAIAALPTPADDHRDVHIVVLTRDGREHLERLLPRLREVGHRRTRVTVVDNASAPSTRDWLDRQPGIRVIHNDSNLSYADANNRAVADVASDVVLFCNDDVEPLDHHWLGRMLAALDGDVVAVGAQLVYPRRPLFDGRMRDVSIQHLGISLEADGDGPPRAMNRGHGADVDPRAPHREVAGATGACLAVRRDAFDAVGGFHPGYQYGAEDVDLCWRLRADGGRIMVAPDAVLWHREGATRHRDDGSERNARQQHNWDLLADRFGPAMRRAVELDRVSGDLVLSDRPWSVGITVTRDLESAGYGDWYTAHELGEAFGELGWHVRYVERYRDAWYRDTENLDLLVVLHDEFDVRRVARPGLITLAWVRGWADRWVGHPWFDELSLVTASSARIADQVVSTTRRRQVPVVPLATNPSRFIEGEGPRHGVVLTVNNWGVDRGIEDLVGVLGKDAQLFGKGWETVPAVAAAWRGHLRYDELPACYREAAVVVDQAAPHTRPFGSVNSRVFDALAAGALVVTDQADGARELFGDLLPVYDGADEAAAVVAEALENPVATRDRAARLRTIVCEHHTYTRRASTFRDLVVDHLSRPTVVVRTGAPDRRQARNWGDTFYANALVDEFRAAGHRAAVQTLDEWQDRRGAGFDVSLHLKGRSRCPRRDGQVHVVWVISHPDEVDPNELEVADLVVVASPLLADELSARLPSVNVLTLLQATDEWRFRPRTPKPRWKQDVVFVGNSRFTERPMVLAAAETGVRLRVHGANWERYLPSDVLGERFVPNEEVPDVYSSASVVINDHWEDMRRWGLVSNRVFDALACGACVVSDDVQGVSELFGDAVATATPETVGDVVRELLADPERRVRMGRQGRELVLAQHTFRHRVDVLLERFPALVRRRRGAECGAHAIRTPMGGAFHD